MARGGYIKLCRCVSEHRFWLRQPFTIGQAWVDLLMLASYQDSTILRGLHPFMIRRGQVLTGLENLRTRWQRGRKTVRAWLAAYETDRMLDIETAYGSDGGYTLLTIRNYERYQGHESDGLDRALDRETDRALDCAMDRAMDQLKEREEYKEVNPLRHRAAARERVPLRMCSWWSTRTGSRLGTEWPSRSTPAGTTASWTRSSRSMARSWCDRP